MESLSSTSHKELGWPMSCVTRMLVSESLAATRHGMADKGIDTGLMAIQSSVDRCWLAVVHTSSRLPACSSRSRLPHFATGKESITLTFNSDHCQTMNPKMAKHSRPLRAKRFRVIDVGWFSLCGRAGKIDCPVEQRPGLECTNITDALLRSSLDVGLRWAPAGWAALICSGDGGSLNRQG